MAFMRFIEVCAARTGRLLNYNDLAKETGISQPTAKKWLSLLVTSGLIYLLEPYSRNIEKRIVKTPKLYFLDTGLESFLTGWETPVTLEKGTAAGPMFETFAVSEILKSWWHNGRQANFYFYRDYGQKEVDFIMENNGILYPVEMKKKSNPTVSDTGSFKQLENGKTNVGPGGVICMASTWLPIAENRYSIPVWYI
jgi:predicted AAA+ superfamily ATPase